MIIGVISDTHGLLRPEALRALEGSGLIVHAGDIGAPAVLETLRGMAPVVAVRGNNDHAPWARDLRDVERFEAGSASICLLHDLKDLAIDPAAEGVQVVIAGHTHQPLVERRDEVLYLNPGSAGPRRFRLPIALARMRVEPGGIAAEIIRLEP
jgi:putative phosphoesterase